MNVVGAGGAARKSRFFNNFTCIFAHFAHFTTFSHAEEIKIYLLS